MMRFLSFIFSLVLISFPACLIAAKEIGGLTFNTKEEYWRLGKPCACPRDLAKNGICGKRAALCKTGGKHILNCDSTKVDSLDSYKRVQKKLCGNNL